MFLCKDIIEKEELMGTSLIRVVPKFYEFHRLDEIKLFLDQIP